MHLADGGSHKKVNLRLLKLILLPGDPLALVVVTDLQEEGEKLLTVVQSHLMEFQSVKFNDNYYSFVRSVKNGVKGPCVQRVVSKTSVLIVQSVRNVVKTL